MTPQPFAGVLLHAAGGFAAGSFYAPLERVRRWLRESFWLVVGLAAWLAAPWAAALATTPELLDVLAGSPATSLARRAVWAGVLTLLASTVIIGHGNSLVR